MARTETVQLVRDRWAALCGLDKDNIISADADVFYEFVLAFCVKDANLQCR